MTDRELKAGMKKNPKKVRSAVFEEYCNYVYAIVINKIRNFASREDIEECVSDVFADFFRSADKLGNNSEDLKNYIGTIARRRAVDAFRNLRKNYGATVSLDDEEYACEIRSDVNIEKATERSERDAILLEKVHELGEPDSTIIIQQYYYNRTSSEIGRIVSMTAAAVQKRSIRARKKLYSMLAEVGVSL